jgi:hypothetical protein
MREMIADDLGLGRKLYVRISDDDAWEGEELSRFARDAARLAGLYFAPTVVGIGGSMPTDGTLRMMPFNLNVALCRLRQGMPFDEMTAMCATQVYAWPTRI